MEEGGSSSERRAPHLFYKWNFDDPRWRYDEIPQRTHVTGFTSQALIETRLMVAVPTPRAADANNILQDTQVCGQCKLGSNPQQCERELVKTQA